jgi:hypothetical protein
MEEKTQIFKNRTVNIFGSKYSIKFVDEVVDRDDNWIYGITDVYNKVIRISTKLPCGKSIQKEELETTLIHELLHAILNSGQYNGYSDDESLVEWIARCLVSLRKQKVL